jgi:homoserine O-acetyltransferase
MRRVFTIAVLAVVTSSGVRAQPDLQFANLGECRLESGAVIEDCRLAYRIFGELNADRSNAILFPTWFSGRTEELEPYVGPGRMIDTAAYFVVAVGAFGNGVSSSPSMSRTQREADFPEFTIADMVNQQHRLVREVLGMSRLKAVVGISMGGMQVFEWAVSHPRFAEKAVSIVGSPRLDAYDLLLWQAELNAIERALAADTNPRRAKAAAMSAVAEMNELALRTPANVNRVFERGGIGAMLARSSTELVLRSDPYDWAAQLRAMIKHDVSRGFGHSLGRAGKQIAAKVLVIISEDDHMVTPQAALGFSEAVGAETLRIEGDCGHLIFECDGGQVAQRVRKFLGDGD